MKSKKKSKKLENDLEKLLNEVNHAITKSIGRTLKLIEQADHNRQKRTSRRPKPDKPPSLQKRS